MNSRLALLLASVACIAAAAPDAHSQDESTVVARRLMLSEPLPLQLCDGGPAYFGVETDLQAEAVIHIDFDSCLCKVTEEAER